MNHNKRKENGFPQKKKRKYNESKYLDIVNVIMYLNHLESLGGRLLVSKGYLQLYLRFLSEHTKINTTNIPLIVKSITDEIHIAYRNYLMDRFNKNEINRVTLRRYLKAANNFVQFLFDNKIILHKLKIEPPNILRTKVRKLPPILELFNKYLDESSLYPTVLLKHAKVFYEYISPLLPKDEFNNVQFEYLSKQQVLLYEDYLSKRILNEEIIKPTATRMLTAVKHFLVFLQIQKVISFKYEIPLYLRKNSKRSNEYINQAKIQHFLETIVRRSQNVYRDLSIILLLVDLGCRPIEISSIKIQDVSFTESTVLLFSKKSGQRKMKISDSVMGVLRQYWDERKKRDYLEGTSLFVNPDGTPIKASNISNIFTRYRSPEDKLNNINAKSLRHTYITNALDNGNDFNKVSKAAGHKQWVSTLYYVYRSKNRMIKNTLPFDPLQMIKGGQNANPERAQD